MDPARPEALMSLPRHARIKGLLLRGILLGAGVSEEEFMDVYR
jgi:hypothetical protein